jgi:hypothetical protein
VAKSKTSVLVANAVIMEIALKRREMVVSRIASHRSEKRPVIGWEQPTTGRFVLERPRTSG